MDCSPSLEANRIIDARGIRCPGPLLKMVKAFDEINEGETVAVFSTDEGVKVDCRAWAVKTGNEFLGQFDRDGFYEVAIRKQTGEK